MLFIVIIETKFKWIYMLTLRRFKIIKSYKDTGGQIQWTVSYLIWMELCGIQEKQY